MLVAVVLVAALGVCTAVYVFSNKGVDAAKSEVQTETQVRSTTQPATEVQTKSAAQTDAATSAQEAQADAAASADASADASASADSANPSASVATSSPGSATPSIPEGQVGWVDGGNGKRYWVKPEDGTLACHEWIEIDGVYQAFDDDGSWVTLGDVIPPGDEANVASMSERQRAVVDACSVTPWPGKALCAAWVSSVFETAGEGPVSGNACDMADEWCDSSDLSALRPGMIIAVPSHGRTENGQIWGHVCIYVGGGLIMDSGTYGIRTSSLGSWLAWFGDLNTPQWGWANGVPLA